MSTEFERQAAVGVERDAAPTLGVQTVVQDRREQGSEP